MMRCKKTGELTDILIKKEVEILVEREHEYAGLIPGEYSPILPRSSLGRIVSIVCTSCKEDLGQLKDLRLPSDLDCHFVFWNEE